MLLPVETLWGYQKKENANIRFIYISCSFYFHYSLNLLTFLPDITQARTVVVEELLLFLLMFFFCSLVCYGSKDGISI